MAGHILVLSASRPFETSDMHRSVTDMPSPMSRCIRMDAVRHPEHNYHATQRRELAYMNHGHQQRRSETTQKTDDVPRSLQTPALSVRRAYRPPARRTSALG